MRLCVRNTQLSSLSTRACRTHVHIQKFLLPPFDLGAVHVRRPTTTRQRVGLVQNKRFTFPWLRGSCNVIEIISQSREKGKGDQCVMPACYLAVFNGVTLHTINLCGLRVSLLTVDAIEGRGIAYSLTTARPLSMCRISGMSSTCS